MSVRVTEAVYRQQSEDTRMASVLRQQLGSNRNCKAKMKRWDFLKLQALVFDIFLPTTAITSYAIGVRELSFSLVFKWQQLSCNRRLELYQVLLL